VPLVSFHKKYSDQKLSGFSVLVLCFLMSARPLTAQTGLDALAFAQYKVGDGLPGNSIRSVVQDKKGYTWVAAANALCRFDGISFTAAEALDSSFHLGNISVFRLGKIDDSLMALTSDKGAYLINTQHVKCRRLFVNDSAAAPGLNYILGFTRLSNGRYLLLSETGRYELDAQGRLLYRQDHASPLEAGKTRQGDDQGGEYLIRLRDNLVACRINKAWEIMDHATHQPYKSRLDPVFRLFDKNVVFRKKIAEEAYVFTKPNVDSLFYLNTKNSELKSVALPFAAWSVDNFLYTSVHALGGDEYAMLSVGSGFYTFTLTASGAIHFNSEKQFPASYCRAILHDEDSRYWIGTVDGLFRQNDPVPAFEHIPIGHGNEELIYNNLFTVNGKLFVSGTSKGYRLQVLDLKTKAILKNIQFAGEETEGSSYEMQQYYKDTLWLSTDQGMLWLDVNTYRYGKIALPGGVSGADLFMMPVNTDGYVWMSSRQKQCYLRYHLKNRTVDVYNSSTKVHPVKKYEPGILYDAYGDVWFYGDGLQRWNSREERFDRPVSSLGSRGNEETWFHYIAADDRGNLWVCPVEKDLICYNIQTEKTERIDLGKYTPLQFYYAFSKIRENYLYLASMDHLIGFNTQTREAVFYNRRENQPVWGSDTYYDEASGQNYISSGGRELFSFSNVPRAAVKKRIVAEYVSSGPAMYHHPGDTIRLKDHENTLNIKFTVLDYDRGHPAKFSYAIDGSETWNTILQAQPVFLYELSPGWHQLRIGPLYRQDNYEPLLFHIYIEPPFWKTVWFLLFSVVVIALLLFLIIRFFVHRAKRESRLILQMKEFELRALHAQMSPHFIFNCLNGIKALVVSGKAAEASRYISSFSKLVRLNLEHSRKPFITLKENMDYIELYLQSEKLRFAHFSYSIRMQVEEYQAAEIKVVPMLLQPIVENAIWHGLQPLSSERILTLSCENNGQEGKFVIEDNGIGIKRSLQSKTDLSKTSVGMENIRERIRLFNQKYHLNYRMEIMDKSDLDPAQSGTRVSIYFNLINNYD
jgi:hypothetical protein